MTAVSPEMRLVSKPFIVSRRVLGCAVCLLSSTVPIESFAQQAESAVEPDAARADASDVAPTREQCVQAHVESQEAQADGRLLLALQDAAICTNSHCPALLVADCASWLDELEQRIPSVVFEVRLDGASNKSARIEVDGEPVKDWARGQGLHLNPGEYQVKFTLDPYPPVERKILLAEGMRFRLISADIRSPHDEARRSEAAQVSRPSSAVKQHRPVPVLFYPLAVLGVGALGSFVGFSLSANAEYDQMSRTCAPFCSEDQVQSVRTRYLVGDISLGVSGLAFAGAAVVYLMRPTRSSAPLVGLTPIRNGGMATFVVQGY